MNLLLAMWMLAQFASSNTGELRVTVNDVTGLPVQSAIELVSQANQVRRELKTDELPAPFPSGFKPRFSPFFHLQWNHERFHGRVGAGAVGRTTARIGSAAVSCARPCRAERAASHSPASLRGRRAAPRPLSADHAAGDAADGDVSRYQLRR